MSEPIRNFTTWRGNKLLLDLNDLLHQWREGQASNTDDRAESCEVPPGPKNQLSRPRRTSTGLINHLESIKPARSRPEVQPLVLANGLANTVHQHCATCGSQDGND